MKSKFKPIIITLLVLVLLVAGAFITNSILSSRNISLFKFTNNNVNDNYSDEFQNDSIPDSTALDDIFGDTLTNEEKDFLTTNNNIESTIPSNDNNNSIDNNDSIVLDNSGLYEADNNLITKANPPKVSTFEKPIPNNTYVENVSKVKNNNKKTEITSFIINYNDRFVASRKNPLLITLAVKAHNNAKFAKVRVYARRVDANYKILSKDLIFYLPKIYVIDGQLQTQFYFAGRISPLKNSKYLPSGRYLLYAEVETVDANGKRVGTAARYPLPKWNYVVTLK